ncbi:MAG: hypothetical protein OIN87_03475 [Candidatus Methanoperedens sp.]|nr:hypothetical protein [Candidatus Methanoperedens sp.]
MKRTFHLYPQNPEFEIKFRFEEYLPFLVKIMAGMDGQSGEFITDGPDRKATPITAKRSIGIEITDKSVDFVPLNKNTLNEVLMDVSHEGTIDFKVFLRYSVLDSNYNRIAFKGDTYLVRTNLEGGILKMNIHLTDGNGRTDCERIADTIVEEIKRNA